MKLNIYKKIFEIMDKYEKMLTYKNNNYIPNKTNNDSNNDTNEYTNNDDFFKFILKNIKIEKSQLYENNIIPINNYILNEPTQNIKSNDNLIQCNSKKINLINNTAKNSDEVKEFIKKIYKKIILKCHPDKNGDKEIFIKCQKYYEDNFLIGLLYLFYKLEITNKNFNEIIFPYVLTDELVRIIFVEIRIIQEKINNF